MTSTARSSFMNRSHRALLPALLPIALAIALVSCGGGDVKGDGDPGGSGVEGTGESTGESTDEARGDTAPAAALAAIGASQMSSSLLSDPNVAPTETDPTKHALAIAIGDYPEYDDGSGFEDINAANDLPLIRAAMARHGFPNEQVTVLADEDAKHDAILEALDGMIEGDDIGPGDTVWIHYSGHGQQVTDDNGDEPDGYDEAIVAWDARSKSTAENPYRGEKHVRDDALGARFRALSAKLSPGGSLLVTMDSCHSGTSTRGAYAPKARGAAPLGPRAERPASRGADEKNQDVASGIIEPGLYRGADPESAANAPAPFVLVAAARHDELNYETTADDGTPVGSLSWAITHAMANLRPGASHRALFREVEGIMSTAAPSQSPQIEGDVDTEVFSGRAVAQTPYHAITMKRGQKVQLDAGSLVGLYEGAKVAFHPGGTSDPSESEPLATGRITVAQPLASVVTLDDGESPPPDDAWAFVEERGYPAMATRVLVDSGADGASEIEEALSSIDTVTLIDASAAVTTPPDVIIRNVDPDANDGETGVEIYVTDAQKRFTRVEDGRSDLPDLIAGEIKRFGRYRYLAGLEMDDPTVAVELIVEPVTWKSDDALLGGGCGTAEPLDAEKFRAPGGGWRFQPGDEFRLAFRNTGTETAYVQVLSILEDGSISMLFPPSIEGQAYPILELPPGDEPYVVNDLCYSIEPPLGRETLKLFATAEQLNLEPLVRMQKLPEGVSRSEGTHPLAVLLDAAYTGTRAGVSVNQSARASRSATDTVVLDIIESRE